MGNQIIHLNDQSFADSVEKNPTPILVDFWAEWCMPCRALAPVIDELAQEFQGKVRFAKVNVDECKDIPAKFGIRGIPTLLLFHDGKKVNELVGNQPKDKIKGMLSKIVEPS
jgi:thioredoxin 1